MTTSTDVTPARRQLVRWTIATTAGHALGGVFWMLPAGWLLRGPGEIAGPASAIVMFALTVVAALAQGALLGVCQGLVLRDILPIKISAWTVATGAGVVAGWVGIVLFAPAVEGVARSVEALLAVAALGGLAYGAILGGAQWAVLSRSVSGQGSWVSLNALLWSVALTVTVAVMQSAGSAWSQIVVGASIAAVLAGAVVAVGTGVYVARRLL